MALVLPCENPRHRAQARSERKLPHVQLLLGAERVTTANIMRIYTLLRVGRLTCRTCNTHGLYGSQAPTCGAPTRAEPTRPGPNLTNTTPMFDQLLCEQQIIYQGDHKHRGENQAYKEAMLGSGKTTRTTISAVENRILCQVNAKV